MTRAARNNVWRDSSGTSVIELGLALPLLMLLVTGGVDVASAFAAKLSFQQAAARTIEKATAGGLNSAAMTTLQAEAATAAGVPADQVVVDSWLECDGVRQASTTVECTSTQQIGRHVSIAITGGYTPKFRFFTSAWLQNGKIPLSAYSSVRVQ